MVGSLLSRLRSRLFSRQPTFVQDLGASLLLPSWPNGINAIKTIEEFTIDENLANYLILPTACNDPSSSLRLDPWPSHVGPRSLSIIKQAAVVGDEFVVLPNGAYLVEPIWHPSLLTAHPAYFDSLYSNRVKRLEGNFFLVPLYWFNNYYHWHAQVLPRLYQVLPCLPEDCFFIVPDTIETWQLDSLTFLGINPGQLLKKPARHKWILQHLYYAPPCAPSSGHTSASTKWVRETITNKIEEISCDRTNDTSSPYIYITRGEASRHINNESSYLPALESMGFVVIDAAQLSYIEQIRLFFGCRFLCGPHGAGMVNMLWTRGQCHVFEIQSTHLLDRGCFWDLSQNLENPYSFYLASSEADGQSPAPLHIDHPNVLIECIEAAMKL